MSSTNFKVIVVGGGPVGLTAAHALTRAGIDFIVLESRPTIVINAGSNLVLLPTGLRLLSQLGLLDSLNAVSSPLSEIQRYDHEGNKLNSAHFFIQYKENHGIAPRIISRHELTKVMYESLPRESQEKMFANKKVCDVSYTPEGVSVTCKDGTSYEGSIVIGADGAHSLIRRCMRNLALQATPKVAEEDINDEQPFLTTYRAMWIRFPTQADLQPGNAIETHGPNATIQLFAGEETSVIGVYERMDKPTRESVRYNETDQEAFVERWGHLPLSEQLTLGDAFRTRCQAGMVNLEEGVVRRFGWNRIVLVGDAAHKFTPSTGAGCNNGIIDIAVLISEINRVVEEAQASGSGVPSNEQITSAFDEYQTSRHEAVTTGCAGASRATATATWQSSVFKFVDLHVLGSRTMAKFFMSQAAPSIARTPVLDFLEGDNLTGGKYAWVHPARSVAVKA